MLARTRIGTLIAALVLAGCAGTGFEVRQFGDMHEVLGHDAALATSRIALGDAVGQPHAYGVGALAGLEGEVTIVDGEAWVARPGPDGLRVSGPEVVDADGAALLVLSHVERWSEVRIERALAGEALEAFVAERAQAAGIDRGRPFPFVIEGDVAEMKMHVINRACPMKPGTDPGDQRQPWELLVTEPTRAQVVGFYAADSVGKLTHPGTSIHAHALLTVDERMVTGHVERLAVAAGAVLRLPA